MKQPSNIGWLLSVAELGVVAVLGAVAGCDRTVVKDEQNQSPVELSRTNADSDQNLNQRPDRSVPVDPMPLQTLTAESVEPNLTSPSSSSNSTEGQLNAPKPQSEIRKLSISPLKSDDPERMIQHLGEIERAIQDLLIASKQMEEQQVRDTAIQLSKMKLQAAEHILHLPTASSEQLLVGLKTQLVALSHLSGLKDVASARQLDELAKRLVEHPDSELRHQGQVVLFGFEIQNLQNGVLTDASRLVQSASELLEDRRFRSRLEMTSLTHAINVLEQMGFTEEAQRLVEVGFEAFSESMDRELRYESWNQLTRQSRSVENFLNSLQSRQNLPSDSGLVLSAARGMVQEFPNPVTIEMIAGVIPDIEYSGNLQLSSELTRLVDGELVKFPGGVSVEAISGTLAEHRQRLSWIDKKLELNDLVDSDGNGLDLNAYEGKVVLIDFWATWCPPCLQEIPNLRQAYQELSGQGFSILSINMDKDPARLSQFLQAQRLPWPTYRAADGDTKRLTDQFGITLFPHTLIMNRQGRIVELHVRGSDVRSRAMQLLNETL